MIDEKGWESAHIDELEALPVDEQGLVWRPVRRRFGIEAFGVNAYTAAKEGDRVVEEHSERTNAHEELYFVARGRAVFALDGEELDAPAGTFVFVRPGTRRGAIAREADTTIVAVGGKPGEPFTVSGWESSFAAFAYLRIGQRERGVALFRETLAEHPDDWAAHYNFACFHALAGERDSALEHLRRAVALNPEARELARTDGDFDAIREDPGFASAVAGEADAPGPGA